MTDRYDYTAFGEIYAQTGTTPNNYLYTGQQYDEVTGLYSLRARYYDPSDGRFLSRDPYPCPLCSPQEYNRYIYTANNPVNFSDPSGLYVLVQQSQVTVNIGLVVKSIGAVLGGALACYDSNWISYMAAAAKIKPLLIALEIMTPSPTPCHIPVLFYPRFITPKIGQHINDAQAAGHPMLLTYDRAGKNSHNKRRQIACRGFTGKPQSCDEYPFASSLQGGLGASIRSVPIWEQRLQGTTMSAFVRTKLKFTDNFAVVVIG
ncbi:MAG: hypothetical protein F9K28_11275 [Bacteroidetes bacterium]|nr:MAG: hypothetical protein F9K28_11275 [Bacteroidota bacterium]